MRVYLDNCCYNRPYDPQEELAVVLETFAKLQIQALMRSAGYVNRERLDYTKWQQTLFAGQSIEEIAAASRRVSAQVIARRAQRLHAMT